MGGGGRCCCFFLVVVFSHYLEACGMAQVKAFVEQLTSQLYSLAS